MKNLFYQVNKKYLDCELEQFYIQACKLCNLCNSLLTKEDWKELEGDFDYLVCKYSMEEIEKHNEIIRELGLEHKEASCYNFKKVLIAYEYGKEFEFELHSKNICELGLLEHFSKYLKIVYKDELEVARKVLKRVMFACSDCFIEKLLEENKND